MEITRKFIEAIPKTDLHLHLDGSVRLDTLIELADEAGVELPSKTVEGLKETIFKYPESVLLVQALRSLGKEHFTDKNLAIFRAAIDSTKYLQIKKDTRSVTGWIFKAIQEICI